MEWISVKDVMIIIDGFCALFLLMIAGEKLKLFMYKKDYMNLVKAIGLVACAGYFFTCAVGG